MGFGRRRLHRLVSVLALTGLAVAACDDRNATDVEPHGTEAIRIAAFNFDESELLAEIYALAIEQQDIPVQRLGRIGPREVVEPALEIGLVDLVPEYAGTMLAFVSLGRSTPTSNPSATLATLRGYLGPRGMRALEPADAQNRNTVIVDRSFAADNNLRSISDLAPLASGLKFGGPAECPERPFCLIGLAEVYGIEFARFVPLPSSGVVADSLELGEIDVGISFSTDPALVENDVVVLVDDLGLQPAENVVPVIREDALQRWGSDLSTALNAVSDRLDTIDLALLNAEAGREGADIGAIAAAWLAG